MTVKKLKIYKIWLILPRETLDCSPLPCIDARHAPLFRSSVVSISCFLSGRYWMYYSNTTKYNLELGTYDTSTGKKNLEGDLSHEKLFEGYSISNYTCIYIEIYHWEGITRNTTFSPINRPKNYRSCDQTGECKGFDKHENKILLFFIRKTKTKIGLYTTKKICYAPSFFWMVSLWF